MCRTSVEEGRQVADAKVMTVRVRGDAMEAFEHDGRARHGTAWAAWPD